MSVKSKRNERHRRRLPVRFGDELPLKGSGFTTNISPKGLAISSPSMPRTGVRMRFEVKVGTETAHLQGRVVWVHRGSATLNIPNVFGVDLIAHDENWFGFATVATPAERTVLAPPPPPSGTPGSAGGAPGGGPSKDMDYARGQPRLRRFPEAFPVRFGATQAMETRGTTIDVSAMGLALAAPLLHEANTQLHLAVTIAAGREAFVEGVVVRARRLSVAQRAANSFAVRLVRADESWFRLIQELGQKASK